MCKKPKRATEQDKETIARLRDQGLSVNPTATKVGLTPSTVHYWANKLGAWPEGRVRPKPKATKPFARNGKTVRPFTSDEDELIVKMRVAGASLSAIGRAVDRPHNSIFYRLGQLSLWAEAETV